MSLSFPNTVLNTIVAEAIDELADNKAKGTGDIPAAVAEIVGESYSANKQICFDEDNYDEAWHAEAEQRGLKNLRSTPDALPEVVSRRPSRRSASTACSPSASSNRDTRCGSSST